jgi:hypothetical protein
MAVGKLRRTSGEAAWRQASDDDGNLAGLVVAWLAIALCEFASVLLHRPPPGVDLRDRRRSRPTSARHRSGDAGGSHRVVAGRIPRGWVAAKSRDTGGWRR